MCRASASIDLPLYACYGFYRVAGLPAMANEQYISLDDFGHISFRFGVSQIEKSLNKNWIVSQCDQNG